MVEKKILENNPCQNHGYIQNCLFFIANIVKAE